MSDEKAQPIPGWLKTLTVQPDEPPRLTTPVVKQIGTSVDHMLFFERRIMPFTAKLRTLWAKSASTFWEPPSLYKTIRHIIDDRPRTFTDKCRVLGRECASYFIPPRREARKYKLSDGREKSYDHISFHWKDGVDWYVKRLKLLARQCYDSAKSFIEEQVMMLYLYVAYVQDWVKQWI